MRAVTVSWSNPISRQVPHKRPNQGTSHANIFACQGEEVIQKWLEGGKELQKEKNDRRKDKEGKEGRKEKEKED